MKMRFHPALSSIAIATIAMLYVPMIAVAIFSLNANRRGYTWMGFTTQWYREMFGREELMSAAINSLILAVVSTLISTVMGTLLALGSSRYPWGKRTKGFMHFLVVLPVVTPDIVFAAAMVVAFWLLRTLSGQLDLDHTWLAERLAWAIGYVLLFVSNTFDFLGLSWTWADDKARSFLDSGILGLNKMFDGSMLTMVIAHVTFQTAFVTMVVQSRLATFERTLEEAARDLYADSWYLMRRVTLPLLMPGIVAGAMLAFTLSLDDFVISFFTAGPDSVTLPLRIHGEARQGRVTPETNALSTLVFLLTVVLVLGTERLTRKEGRKA